MMSYFSCKDKHGYGGSFPNNGGKWGKFAFGWQMFVKCGLEVNWRLK